MKIQIFKIKMIKFIIMNHYIHYSLQKRYLKLMHRLAQILSNITAKLVAIKVV